ncbi:MAG: hypothetical protein CBC09_08045 [Cellvibrionales bacterium TMED49]|nr:hypothetical protein [Porticoccaceae bacterium]OUU36856.1 MAG: hypothetical protein CBC09_08045 [Cellvibrionales bacterium TMED49]
MFRFINGFSTNYNFPVAITLAKVGTAVFLFVFACKTFSTETFSAEEKLEAIKQALVDLAMESEVTLGSAAYIDDKGVLHESTLMSSSNNVRGVRVLSYLEEAGIPVARVEASMLSDRTCPGARPELRREAVVRVGYSGENKRLGDHYMSEIAALSEDVLIESFRSSSAWTARPEVRFASNYDNLVSGASSDRVPYRLDVRLSDYNPAAKAGPQEVMDVVRKGFEAGKSAVEFSLGFAEWSGVSAGAWSIFPLLNDGFGGGDYAPDPSTDPAIPANPYYPGTDGSGQQAFRKFLGAYNLSKLPDYARDNAPWSGSRIDLEFELVDRQFDTPMWSKTVTLNYPRLKKGYSKEAIPPEFKHQIVVATEHMLTEITESMSCVAQYYHLKNADGASGTASINAGSLAGVMVGDQFLLSSDPNILNAAIDSSALSTLSLARVESVSRHSAVLRHIAGPRWTSSQANENLVALYF